MIYYVVIGWSRGVLAIEVNKMLADGWTLQGGVAIGMEHDAPTYAQAMVKNDGSDRA